MFGKVIEMGVAADPVLFGVQKNQLVAHLSLHRTLCTWMQIIRTKSQGWNTPQLHILPQIFIVKDL